MSIGTGRKKINASINGNRLSLKNRRRFSIPSLIPDLTIKDDVGCVKLGEPRDVVDEIEAKVGRNYGNKKESECWNRARAKELHREADHLYYKGDYESALVLYHRAASLNPRETMHAVAARRTEAVLSSASSRQQFDESPTQLSTAICPEAMARRARAIVDEADDPIQEIPRILRFFDAKKKDFERLSTPHLTVKNNKKHQVALLQRQLSRCMKSSVRELERAHEIGDTETVRQLSDELVGLVSLTETDESGSKNRIAACGYLALKQIELGRHDRALEHAARMIFLARTSGDGMALAKALVTLGKVHIGFGHLDALARVWERLVCDIGTEKLAQAWLYHDLGRCHLELGNLKRGLDASCCCLELATALGSKKWTLRGHLLRGQLNLKIGNLIEAVSALKTAARLAEQEEENETNGKLLGYVQDLIDQVTRLLRRLNEERERRCEMRHVAIGVSRRIPDVNLTAVDSRIDEIEARTEVEEEEEEDEEDEEVDDETKENEERRLELMFEDRDNDDTRKQSVEASEQHQQKHHQEQTNDTIEHKAPDDDEYGKVDEDLRQLLKRVKALRLGLSLPVTPTTSTVATSLDTKSFRSCFNGNSGNRCNDNDSSGDRSEEEKSPRSMLRNIRWHEDSVSFDGGETARYDEDNPDRQSEAGSIAIRRCEKSANEINKEPIPQPYRIPSMVPVVSDNSSSSSSNSSLAADNDRIDQMNSYDESTFVDIDKKTSKRENSFITDYLKSLETQGYDEILNP